MTSILSETGRRSGAAPHVERAALPDRRPLRVAFAVGGLITEGSGVARIVCDLANALSRSGTPIDIFTADCRGHGVSRSLLDADNRVHAPPGRWAGRLAWSPPLKRLLLDALPNFDVVHNHSLWMLPTSYASRAARRYQVPVVFTVHGFLEPWALAHSRWKKRLAGWLFQNADLRRAACLHVNSRSELAGLRAYGLKNPVAIIPNGVDLRHFDDPPPRAAFEQLCPATRNRRVCLFLSRLHEKKGLGHLVQAWARLAREFTDWHLVIAGPDDGYEQRLREQIDALGLQHSVSLTGPLYGEQKYAAFAAAELFVLPSFSEGFSMAVLEALSAGLPVLMTPGCNFPEAASAGAAIEVAPDCEATERGLRQLLTRSPDELAEMGRTGRRLIERSYTWHRVAEQTLQLYRWLATGGDRPDFVTTR